MLSGTMLGPYRIEAKLGEGGMGEVYKARDTKLDRDVALKVLPEVFAGDPDRLAWFEREAKVIASLNHPNIAQIHGLEETQGVRALVLELVEGATLADRIGQGAIPLDEALGLARQIAKALQAAHEAGVIHRDLKPANIKVKPDGTVKVLDFGLAKALAPDAAGASTDDVANSPTMTASATRTGIIMGTAAYMSPEQARGEKVDKRSDIWAYGVVLHELLTGRQLFQGKTLADILAAVLIQEPDLTEAPERARRLLRACLERDPKKRLQDIGDAWRLVEDAPAQAPVAVTPASTSRLPWLAAGLALLAATVLAFVHFGETPPEMQAVQFLMDPPPESDFTRHAGGIAPSPDGRYVVFAAQGSGPQPPMLWLRQLDSLAARPLPGTENGNYPTWSPDGRSLAFYADGKLKRVDLAGGAPLSLADAQDTSVSATGTWNRDGVILFGGASGIQRVSATGGGATALTQLDASAGEAGHGYPQFLPDGNHFLYFAASSDPDVQGVYASSLENPNERRQVLRTGTKAVYIPPRGPYPGYLLWMQERTLLAQRFNTDALERQGEPIMVAGDILINPAVNVRAAYWASESGLLVWFSEPAAGKRSLQWIGRDGKPLGEAAPDDTYSAIALAPGGQRVAVARTDQASGQDIWLRDLVRGVSTRLTTDPARDAAPVWSPDGRWVAFVSDRDNGRQQIYRRAASGAGGDELLTEGPNPKLPLDWSRDGKFLLYRERNPQTGGDIMALPLDGDHTPIPVVQTPFEEVSGTISPDGRWVAYLSADSVPTALLTLYVQAFPGVSGAPEGRAQIAPVGAGEAKWRGDGREIYYESLLDGRMMAVAIQAGPQGIVAETPRELFAANLSGSYHEFDVAPDGQRFLLIVDRAAAEAFRLTVVSNWQAALRK